MLLQPEAFPLILCVGVWWKEDVARVKNVSINWIYMQRDAAREEVYVLDDMLWFLWEWSNTNGMECWIFIFKFKIILFFKNLNFD